MYIGRVDYVVGKIYCIRETIEEDEDYGALAYLVLNCDGLYGAFITKNGLRTIDLNIALVYAVDYCYLGIDEIKSIITEIIKQSNQGVMVGINIREVLASASMQLVDFFMEDD